jgi:hypothetical protein
MSEQELSGNALKNFRKLQADPVLFYEIFLQEDGEELYDYQKELMWDIAQRPMIDNPIYKDYIVLKGRQIGASWISGILALWGAMMHDHWEVVVVSFNLEQAQRILGYAKSFAERLKKRGLYKKFVEGQRGTNLRFKNGSIITAVGCTRPEAHNVRNYHAHMLFIDEGALVYDKMFPSITPLTAQTGGKMIMLSTAGSVGSMFHRLWQDGNTAAGLREDYGHAFKEFAEGYTNREAKRMAEEKIGRQWNEILKIKSYTIPSSECPDLTPEKLNSERRNLGEIRYMREYECIWAGTSDQIFTNIPTYSLDRMITRTKKQCFGGMDVGKAEDPTVLIIIEAFQDYMPIQIDGVTKEVFVPYRVIFVKEWKRERMRTIANYIKEQVMPRFNLRLIAIDITGGHGDELMRDMVELELPCKGLKVKHKSKNNLMLGVDALDDAFMAKKLWINRHVNDLGAEDLRFELAGYIGKLTSTGYYVFDSTVDRDHKVDSLAYCWDAVKAGSFEPIMLIR